MTSGPPHMLAFPDHRDRATRTSSDPLGTAQGAICRPKTPPVKTAPRPVSPRGEQATCASNGSTGSTTLLSLHVTDVTVAATPAAGVWTDSHTPSRAAKIGSRRGSTPMAARPAGQTTSGTSEAPAIRRSHMHAVPEHLRHATPGTSIGASTTRATTCVTAPPRTTMCAGQGNAEGGTHNRARSATAAPTPKVAGRPDAWPDALKGCTQPQGRHEPRAVGSREPASRLPRNRSATRAAPAAAKWPSPRLPPAGPRIAATTGGDGRWSSRATRRGNIVRGGVSQKWPEVRRGDRPKLGRN